MTDQNDLRNRVARGMFERKIKGDPFFFALDWDNLDPDVQRHWLKMADAALAEMDAMLAKAREDALREAYQNLRTFAPHHEHDTGTEHNIGYANGYHTAMNRILALIDQTAEGDT